MDAFDITLTEESGFNITFPGDEPEVTVDMFMILNFDEEN